MVLSLSLRTQRSDIAVYTLGVVTNDKRIDKGCQKLMSEMSMKSRLNSRSPEEEATIVDGKDGIEMVGP